MFLNDLQYRSYEDLNRLIHQADINNFRNFDLVLGVPRSGMVPAYMIGLLLNLPVIDIESFMAGIEPYVGKRLKYKKNEIRKVLVVDDSIKFGGQLKDVKQKLNSLHSIRFKYLSVFATSDSKEMVDYYWEIIDKPRVFQWNLLNSWVYEYSCVDIDGVLCEDPSEEENDDGERYLEFLENARTKFLPSCVVGVLVTSRLEKYRRQTEDWLSKQGVQYRKLVMLDLPDKKTRVKLGLHSKFKSKVYAQDEQMGLFIESSKYQSEEIHKHTGKNVFCVENMTFYHRREDIKNDYLKSLWEKLKKG
jgi:uncharacterized HAD superfamily protein/adenine/guanine phosphoribosyltransferase-like PRPP-binding protein